MRTTDPGDAARVELLLAELRLPAIKQVWASLAAQADKEGQDGQDGRSLMPFDWLVGSLPGSDLRSGHGSMPVTRQKPRPQNTNRIVCHATSRRELLIGFMSKDTRR